MGAPKVYISYAYDTDEFKEWVRKFTDRLREKGVDAKLDKYELLLTDHIPEFMEKGIADSDFVIFLITDAFIKKSKERKAGLGYELRIATGEIFVKNKWYKYIPVLIKVDFADVPPFLYGTKAIRIVDMENYSEQFIELYAYLTNQPLLEKPSLGPIVKIADLKKEETLFDIEGLKSRSQMEDFVLWRFRIVNHNFKPDELAHAFPKYKKSFLSKYQGQLNSTRYYPTVLDPNNQKMEGTKIVYESKPSRLSNWYCCDKIVFTGNRIEYGFVELMKFEPRMVLVNARLALVSFFYLMIMLKKFHSKEDFPIDLTVTLDLTASDRGLYSPTKPLFKVASTMFETYVLADLQFHCDQDFKDLGRETLQKFFQKILGAFVSSDSRSGHPLLEIEQDDFSIIYSATIRANYWDPLIDK